MVKPYYSMRPKPCLILHTRHNLPTVLPLSSAQGASKYMGWLDIMVF